MGCKHCQKKNTLGGTIFFIFCCCSYDDHTKLLCEEMSISLDGDDERTLTMVQDVDASDLIQESLPVPVHDDIIEAGSSQGMEGAILQGLGNDADVEQSKQVEENKRNILAALQKSE